MADETGKEQTKNTWPLVKFAFSVKIGSTEGLFEEVTGLNAETQLIEYRAGNSKVFSTVKMPGIKKYSNITLKKGIFKDDKAMWTLYDAVKNNTFERKTLVISLLDEEQKVAMSWNVLNAFPVKMTVSDMKSDANEGAIESIELAHEGLDIAK
jgi:phage tail-like protein